MSLSSIRLAIATNAMIFTLLSIAAPALASDASYKTCFKGWTFGYDKSQQQAEIKAKAAWNTKAQNTLATHNATWKRTTNRRTHIIKVFLKGQPAHKVSVYGKYCEFNQPGTKPTPIGVAG